MTLPAGRESFPRSCEGQAELTAGTSDGCLLAAVPCRLGGGILAAEAAEHVQVFVKRRQVVVHQPAHPLERLDTGLAQVARDHPGLSGAPGQRVERGDTPVPGQDAARHPQLICTRPAFHQQGRDQVAGRVRTPLARERLTVALFVPRRAGSRPLVHFDHPRQPVSELAQGASGSRTRQKTCDETRPPSAVRPLSFLRRLPVRPVEKDG